MIASPLSAHFRNAYDLDLKFGALQLKMLAHPTPLKMGGLYSIGSQIVSCRAIPESDKFVDVEQQPRKVADEEDEDESHEDGRQIVLETATPLVDVLKGMGWKMKQIFLARKASQKSLAWIHTTPPLSRTAVLRQPRHAMPPTNGLFAK